MGTGIALVAGAVTAVAVWEFLDRFWRPRKIKQALFARLRSLDIGDWWPALAAFGELMNRPWRGDSELVAAYGTRLIGEKRWASLTAGVDPALLIPYTRPRSEFPGTSEYEAAQRRPPVSE